MSRTLHNERYNDIDELVLTSIGITDGAQAGLNSRSFVITDQRREAKRRALERFILTLSEQQLVSGVAMLIAIYTKYCHMSVYSFRVAASVAWFSMMHLGTLTVLPNYFDKHPLLRTCRIATM
jgi:hypothetical protein